MHCFSGVDSLDGGGKRGELKSVSTLFEIEDDVVGIFVDK